MAVPYISGDALAARLKDAAASGSGARPAIVDVRDADFAGGHIVGARNVPSEEFHERVEGLVQSLAQQPTVVFHCSLSQQRGPAAARAYVAARSLALKQQRVDELPAAQRIGSEQGAQHAVGGQEVCILRNGFSEFGKLHKNDAQLVQDYDEEAWSYR
ncbi:Rhodanese-like protein [Tilletiopsis washingtonensis]|uniref:Rhodanese-like protein n=1 Tax=Tilletiopsis washingtonensis TaxID=58919 RepID=A0A316ZKA3_9BASI|nr:Rhodanese-like protein [Tilletiopsis washingtonensis]PWO01443.1 Rhodanese-like protein [Tilletiopsis washingtonensis]